MSKKVFVRLAICFISLVTNHQAFAQVTVGLTYAELTKCYNSAQDLSDWEEKKADDGTVFISYRDKGRSLLICSYFDKDTVWQYKLIGKTKDWANLWGEYADRNFARQGHGVWFDYASNQKWILKVRDSEFTTFIVVKLDE